MIILPFIHREVFENLRIIFIIGSAWGFLDSLRRSHMSTNPFGGTPTVLPEITE